VSVRAAPVGLGDEDLLIAVANTAHDVRNEQVDPAAVRAWWLGPRQPVVSARSVDPEAAAALRALRVAIRP
jgi:hypothetical protein